ncbi:BatD family protein [Pontibacter sp. KCTC 32443]|uniref:BatD family protein n=1 Tax=Pontibacter TaxID=323449 RepID=UPI00164E7DFB|nr:MULTISPECIES: BatD family protein [Pontibacter]MBC5774001.1 BatD family protein [Pontibacter sp. KCTC 32443]
MRYIFLTLLFLLLLPGALLAQQISIALGKSPLPLNQYYTIGIKLQDQALKEYSPFPEIEGFKKSTKYSSTETIITGGSTTKILTIYQNYAPLAEGEFVLKPFSMKVNGQTVQSPGTTIVVKPMTATVTPGTNVPDLIAPEEEPETTIDAQPEYIEKDDNAFLTLYTNKNEVYVGEGFTAALYFYLAAEDQQLLEFYDFTNQITGILRQLKQPNVWEEAFEVTEITPENVLVEGKPYLRFKLYESVLYPINLQPIRFPQLSLKMLKYKVAKKPNLLNNERQEGYKTYFAREREIKVKQLPPHPLRDAVPVGNYRLREQLSQQKGQVNKSLTYLFQVEGEGNLAAIMPPVPEAPSGLDFYPPDVRQDVTRRAGRVLGSKSFTYTVLPREPGKYKLQDVMQWIYFDPITARYDTLRPKLTVSITGTRDTDALVLSRDLGPFYRIIGNEDDTLVSLHQFDDIRRYTNIILVVLLVVSGFIFIKKRKL